MRNKDSGETRFIIGFDLRDDFCQMSFCTLPPKGGLPDPTTWSAVPGQERFNIPAVLSKETGVNRWQYGEAAAAHASEEGFTYVPHLLMQALESAAVPVEEEQYDAQALLALFIGQCLGELPEQGVDAANRILVFTSRRMDGQMVSLLENVRMRLNLKGQVFCLSHAAAAYYYMLGQDRSLREPACALFEYEPGGELLVSRLICNTRTKPIVVFEEESVFPGLHAQSDAGRDEEFARIVRSELAGRSCSSAYLLGSGFRGGWMKRSVRLLCEGGRRVFLGGNLYSKGAACAGMLRSRQAGILSEYFFLDGNKLRTNVLLQALVRGQERTVTLVEAGANWYEVQETRDLILDGTGEINLILKPLTGGAEVPFHIRLEGLPVREGRVTRIRVTFTMSSAEKLHLMIEDLGFGETFPSSGLRWEQEITVRQTQGRGSEM